MFVYLKKVLPSHRNHTKVLKQTNETDYHYLRFSSRVSRHQHSECPATGIPRRTRLGTLCRGWTQGNSISRDQPERLRQRIVARCCEPAQPHRGVRRERGHSYQFTHRIQEQPLRGRTDGSRRGHHRVWRRCIVLWCRQQHRALYALPHGRRRHKGQGLCRHRQRTGHDLRPLLICLGTGREFLHQLG